jgi:hypothetical protein
MKKSHFRCVVWQRISHEQGQPSAYLGIFIALTGDHEHEIRKTRRNKSNQIETEARNRSTNLVEMLSELNPMFGQFVPPSLANHDRYFDNRFRFKLVCFNILKIK